MQWHFNPETGTPFWLDFAKKLDWDPRKEIQTYADLDRFGFFQDEWLRGGPVRRWVPKAYADRPIYTFETGGSTGVPKSRINIDDFRIDYEMFSDTLPDEHFPHGSDWLMVGPSGPRRLRLAVEHLAQHRGGISFCVDLDPRWVIKLIKARQMDQMEAYKRHVIEQALTLLKAHDNIRCMFITPKLLEALAEKISLKKAGITRHLLRRHRDDAAVPPLGARGSARRHLLRADLRQHADGPRGPQAVRPQGQLRDHLLPAAAARACSRSSIPTSRCASSATAKPAACG